MERLLLTRPSGRAAPALGRPRGAERGFTLIELTVVVIIVGVFAAMAIPQVTLQLRDRKVREAAQRIAIVYQQARMRALGQGGAVLVRYLGAGQGSFETRIAQVGKLDKKQKCEELPAVSCTQTAWDDAANNQFRSIETLTLSQEPGLREVYTKLTTDAGAAGTDMDVCFTPVGRAFMRFSVGDPWGTPQGVPVISVGRMASGDLSKLEGLLRKVLVLPTGIARLQL